jgi:hypothetical protein
MQAHTVVQLATEKLYAHDVPDIQATPGFSLSSQRARGPKPRRHPPTPFPASALVHTRRPCKVAAHLTSYHNIVSTVSRHQQQELVHGEQLQREGEIAQESR